MIQFRCYYDDEPGCNYYLNSEQEIKDGICENCQRRIMEDRKKLRLQADKINLDVTKILKDFFEKTGE